MTYVPHLPSYHVVDLLTAVCCEAGQPEVVVHDIPVRPGEKMAELLATDDEMDRAMTYHTREGARYYGIPPTASSWEPDVICPGVRQSYAVEAGGGVTRPYQSNTWPWRLSVEDLRQRLELAGV